MLASSAKIKKTGIDILSYAKGRGAGDNAETATEQARKSSKLNLYTAPDGTQTWEADKEYPDIPTDYTYPPLEDSLDEETRAKKGTDKQYSAKERIGAGGDRNPRKVSKIKDITSFATKKTDKNKPTQIEKVDPPTRSKAINGQDVSQTGYFIDPMQKIYVEDVPTQGVNEKITQQIAPNLSPNTSAQNLYPTVQDETKQPISEPILTGEKQAGEVNQFNELPAMELLKNNLFMMGATEQPINTYMSGREDFLNGETSKGFQKGVLSLAELGGVPFIALDELTRQIPDVGNDLADVSSFPFIILGETGKDVNKSIRDFLGIKLEDPEQEVLADELAGVFMQFAVPMGLGKGLRLTSQGLKKLTQVKGIVETIPESIRTPENIKTVLTEQKLLPEGSKFKNTVDLKGNITREPIPTGDLTSSKPNVIEQSKKNIEGVPNVRKDFPQGVESTLKPLDEIPKTGVKPVEQVRESVVNNNVKSDYTIKIDGKTYDALNEKNYPKINEKIKELRGRLFTKKGGLRQRYDPADKKLYDEIFDLGKNVKEKFKQDEIIVKRKESEAKLNEYGLKEGDSRTAKNGETLTVKYDKDGSFKIESSDNYDALPTGGLLEWIADGKTETPIKSPEELKSLTEKPVPEFKNSREAIDFGKTATDAQIEQLKIQRETLDAELSKMSPKDPDFIKKAVKHQMIDEAITAKDPAYQETIKQLDAIKEKHSKIKSREDRAQSLPKQSEYFEEWRKIGDEITPDQYQENFERVDKIFQDKIVEDLKKEGYEYDTDAFWKEYDKRYAPYREASKKLNALLVDAKTPLDVKFLADQTTKNIETNTRKINELKGLTEKPVEIKDNGFIKEEGYNELTAVKDGKEVGRVEILENENGTFTAENIFVEPEYRRQGIATKLMEEAKKKFNLEDSKLKTQDGQKFTQKPKIKETNVSKTEPKIDTKTERVESIDVTEEPTLDYVNKEINQEAIKKYGKVIRIEPEAFSRNEYNLVFESGHEQVTKIPKRKAVWENYDDAKKWLEIKYKEYGGKNKFLMSDEYKTRYDEIKQLYDKERIGYVEKSKTAMGEAGIKYGDRVEYDHVSPYGSALKYSGVVVERNGLPYVKFDKGQYTIDGKKSSGWNKGWRKEGVKPEPNLSKVPTFDEYMKLVDKQMNPAERSEGYLNAWRKEHKKLVEKSIEKGKTVSDEVLKDYPELKPQTKVKISDFGKFKEIDLSKPTEDAYMPEYEKDFGNRKSAYGISTFAKDKMDSLDFYLKQAGHKGTNPKDFKGIYSLDKIIDNPKLFDKYPQLKDVNVIFADFHTPRKYGMKVNNDIYINSKLYEKNPVKLQGTIVHEVQHIKQDITGKFKSDSDEVIRDAKREYANKYVSEKEVDARRKQQEFYDSYEQNKQIIKQAISQKSLDMSGLSKLVDMTDKKVLKATYDIAKYHFENGITKLGDFARQMVKDVGDWIKPHIKRLWEEVKAYATGEKSIMGEGLSLNVPPPKNKKPNKVSPDRIPLGEKESQFKPNEKTIHEDIRTEIKDYLAKDLDLMRELRRGRITDAQALKKATEFGVKIATDFGGDKFFETIKSGDVFPIEEHLGIVGYATKRFKDVMKDKTLTAQDRFKVFEMYAKSEAISGELARSLRGRQLIPRIPIEDINGIAKDIIDSPDIPKEQKEAVRKIAEDLKKNPDAIKTPNWYDKLRYIFYNAILSRPMTHARNIVGNTGHLIWDYSLNPVSPRKVWQNADFKKTLKKVWDEGGDVSKFTEGQYEPKTKWVRNSMPTSWLKFEDVVFKEFAKGIQKTREAKSIAKEYNISYDNAIDAINNVLDGKTLKGEGVNKRLEKAVDSIEEYAKFVTFQKELGTPGTRLQSFLRSIPGSELIVPFVRTPANIMKVGLQPLKVLKYLTKEQRAKFQEMTPVEKRMEIRRITAGALMYVALQQLVANGVIEVTGQGANDKSKQDFMEKQGWKPNSIKIGNKYISYQNINPFNVGLGIIGNYSDGLKYNSKPKDDELNIVQKWSKTLAGFVATTTDQSFLRGLSDLANWQRTENPYYLEGFVNSFIPGVLSTVKDVTGDGMAYENKTVGEKISNRLGITSGLKPRINVFGEQEKERGSGLPVPTPETPDELSKALLDNNVTISYPKKDIIKADGQKVTDDEYYNFVKESGQRIKKKLDEEFELIKTMEAGEMNKEIDRVVNSIRDDVKEEMFGKKENKKKDYKIKLK